MHESGLMALLRWVRATILPPSRGAAGPASAAEDEEAARAGEKTQRLRPRRRKRWWIAVAIVAGLLLAYTAAGFLLVPWAIKNQVPKFAQTELGRRAAIDEVRFNPYTLRLQARNLSLTEADGAPLLAIGELAAQLQWKSLLRRTWTFSGIRIAGPDLKLTIAPDGRFNLAELIDTLRRRRSTPSTDNRPPPLVIERFALERGKVEVHDHRVNYAENFFPIDLALNNFSTLPEQSGSASFSADSEQGGKLRWKGDASLNPIGGSGELILENVSLPALSAYLKSRFRGKVTAGRLSANLPYRFSYRDGKFDASLAGARLALRDLALAQARAGDAFARLARLEASGIDADLGRRQATVGELRIDGGKLAIRRDAKGNIDLADLLIPGAQPAAPDPRQASAAGRWKLEVRQVALDQVALSALDETANPPARLSADKARLRLHLQVEQAGADLKLKVSNASLSLADVMFASGAQTPLKLAQLGFAGGAFDLAARHASLQRLYAEGGRLQLVRGADGQIDLLRHLPGAGSAERKPAPQQAAGKPWTAAADRLELSKIGADIEDQGSGIKLHVEDLAAKIEGAGSDLARPLKFDAGLNLREGGRLSAQGQAVPASGMLQAQVQIKQLALAPLQPLLGTYLKLKIAGGSVSTQGALTTGAATAREAGATGGTRESRLRYVGGVDIANLALNEENGDPFLAWKNASTDRLVLSLAPNRLSIADLRLVEPDAKLIIENDRSFNAARLLKRPAASGKAPASAAAAPAESPAEASFPVRIKRLRVQNARLDFTDLSLRPQFNARIRQLSGVVTDLSSSRNERSQIALDGQVGEFGQARIRGRLNPFAPRDDTDVRVSFKNIDMVTATPYAMKFAGYKIDRGRISLDLRYQVRNSRLEGDNRIIIDNLVLGERVDSPDAFKLPLDLAIAVLKDSHGRIDLGLPVSGDLNDPQFSYGAVIWKALDTLLARVVSAPFRALAGLAGHGGEQLDAIEFDPGSAKLAPPEREKLQQVAQLLSQHGQLKLVVPGQYSEEADGAALKARAAREEIARRAGIRLEEGERAGLDPSDRAVRRALREMYAERFGAEELDRQKKAAESAAAGEGQAAAAELPIWRRVGKLVEGEPQVPDPGPFYRALRKRLEQTQPLPADALPALGAQRANAILAALKEFGVDPARAAAAPPEKIASDAGKPVPLKLGVAK